jgi:hypothetical protein
MARRYRRRADLDSPVWWAGVLIVAAFWIMLYALIATVWLVWAAVALPVAAIAALSGHDELARSVTRSLALSGWLVRR